MSGPKHAKRHNARLTAPSRPSKPASAAHAAKPAATAPRAAKFARTEGMLSCPVCGAPLRLEGQSLRCKSGHDFPISRKGTVNFLSRPHPSEGYDQEFFENRRKVFEAGYYDRVVEGVAAFFDARPELRRIVDAGCGEGYYAKRLLEDDAAGGNARTVVGLDLSKEAVSIAARGGNDVCWAVADVAALPLLDASADAVLDVFTPAHYAEFARVLAPNGMLAKVVPGPRHLQELRHAFRDRIRHEEYSNELVVERFQESFEIVDRISLSKTTPTTPDELRAFVRMTPLLFHVDEQTADACSVPEITIDAELLVGRPRL